MKKTNDSKIIERRRKNVERVQKWRKRYPGRYKKLTREYWSKTKNDPEKLEKQREYGRRYYQEHREERVKSVQEFWKRNPEKRKYYQLRSAIKNKKRLLKLRFSVFARDDFTCQYCGRSVPEVELEVDHKVPIAVSGVKRNYRDISTNMKDYVTACKECNVGKRDAILKMYEK